MAEPLATQITPSVGKLLEERETLDDLLERYLSLLDQHQNLQRELSENLSSVQGRQIHLPPTFLICRPGLPISYPSQFFKFQPCPLWAGLLR